MIKEDFYTPAWRRLKEHLEARLEELRIDNDRLTNNEHQTTVIRGRIDEVKKLLALAAKARAGDDAEPGESWPRHPAE